MFFTLGWFGWLAGFHVLMVSPQLLVQHLTLVPSTLDDVIFLVVFIHRQHDTVDKLLFLG